MTWKTRLQEAFRPHAIDSDVLEELAQHAAATYAAARAEGLSPYEAEKRVEIQIQAWVHAPSLLKRRPRRVPAVEPPAGSSGLLLSIVQDARYALRLLRRQPAYAALVIATMALGIAATTVLGSVAYGVLLKPLPWADAPRLVRLYETRQGSTRRFSPMMTNITYRAWRDSLSTLEAIGGWSAREVTLVGQGGSERISVGLVTPELFSMLDAKPAFGRAFSRDEDDPSKPPAVILSYGFWQQRFGGRGDALGQTLRLDKATYTVVGVMAADFDFPDRETRAWIPFYIPPVITPGKPGRSIAMFQSVGRLRAGATPQQAAAEGTARGRSVPDPGPVTMAVFGSNGPVEVAAVPLLESLVSDVKPAILILFGAVVLLLATATANVASLQLARATARRRELAIRSALGAERARLVRQTLVENLVLGLLGGAGGITLAAALQRALPAILPARFPRLGDIAFDWRILLFAIAVSIAAGLGCGLLPAWNVARNDVVPALAEDALAPAGGGLRTRMSRIRAAIMAGQLAIASVLLVGALLLVRSFVALLHANVGYDPLNVLTARLILPDAGKGLQRLETMHQMVGGLNATEGVRIAAFANSMPFAPREALSSFPLRKHDGSTAPVQTGSRLVSGGYFSAMAQRVIEGRDFSSSDTRTSERVAIVNREFARKYLDGRALDWMLPGTSTKPDARIVGVVEDTVRHGVTDAPQPEMYAAVDQDPDGLVDATVNMVVRTAGDPRGTVPALRAAARRLAPAAALDSISTMQDLIGNSLAQPRLYTVLLGTFAAFAVIIAGVGLFGVLSYTVAQRSREIGVRSALGARMRDIVGLVLRQSMAIALAGIAIGLSLSAWLTRMLQKFLYGVTPHDATTFAGVAAMLVLVAAIATIVPARRAARVDPVSVLRS